MPTVPVDAMKNNKIKDCCHNITYNYDGSEAYLHFDEDSIFDKSPIKITPITIIKREFTKGNILSPDNKGNMDEEMRKKISSDTSIENKHQLIEISSKLIEYVEKNIKNFQTKLKNY